METAFHRETFLDWAPYTCDTTPLGGAVLDVAGMTCIIETPKGATRDGWDIPLAADYGYISGTGSAEGASEQMDCFIGNDEAATHAYVIHQDNAEGAFDEHKVMLKFPDQESAVAAYTASYPPGQDQRIRQVEAMPLPALKQWLDDAWSYAIDAAPRRRRRSGGAMTIDIRFVSAR